MYYSRNLSFNIHNECDWHFNALPSCLQEKRLQIREAGHAVILRNSMKHFVLNKMLFQTFISKLASFNNATVCKVFC